MPTYTSMFILTANLNMLLSLNHIILNILSYKYSIEHNPGISYHKRSKRMAYNIFIKALNFKFKIDWFSLSHLWILRSIFFFFHFFLFSRYVFYIPIPKLKHLNQSLSSLAWNDTLRFSPVQCTYTQFNPEIANLNIMRQYATPIYTYTILWDRIHLGGGFIKYRAPILHRTFHTHIYTSIKCQTNFLSF